MKREPVRKQTYEKPSIEVIHTLLDNELMGTSFPNNGGHNKAGDDGDDIDDAKPGWFDEDEEDETPKWGI